MPSPQLITIQNEVRQFCSTKHWTFPLEVTLTMRQMLFDPFRQIDHQHAQQNFRHFMNLLNREVYGHAFRRYDKRLRVVPVVEGTNFKRMHYHALVDCPTATTPEYFIDLIKDCWMRTEWSLPRTYIVQSSNDISDGYLSYITKFRDKPNFADSIDWFNFHND